MKIEIYNIVNFGSNTIPYWLKSDNEKHPLSQPLETEKIGPFSFFTVFPVGTVILKDCSQFLPYGRTNYEIQNGDSVFVLRNFSFVTVRRNTELFSFYFVSMSFVVDAKNEKKITTRTNHLTNPWQLTSHPIII